MHDLEVDFKGQLYRIGVDIDNLKKFSHDCNKAPWAKWIITAIAILFVSNLATSLWMMSISTDVARVHSDAKEARSIHLDMALKNADRISKIEGRQEVGLASIQTLQAAVSANTKAMGGGGK